MPRCEPLYAVPSELRALPRWACWQEQPGYGKKPGKPPIQANIKFTGQHVYAKTNDPKTWASFGEALNYRRTHLPGEDTAAGLSFALNGDGIVGIDLDKCRDAESKTIAEWALKTIKRFGSYTEISPSGTGIRIFLRGKLPAGGRHKGTIEVYDSNKFLTVTGRKWSGRGIEDRSAELLAWHREVFGEGLLPTSTKGKGSNGQLVVNGSPNIDPAQFEQLFRAKPKAREVFQGSHTYKSQSDADMALANYATAAGLTAQQTCDLLVAARTNAGERIKPVDYFERTIGKARDGSNAVPVNCKAPVGLAEVVAKLHGPGTDEVAIGVPDELDDVKSATMADAAELVAGIRYLVRDWVPFGMVTGIVAEPGVGKSAFALYGLARPVVTGFDWFTGTKGPDAPGHVLWCGTENDIGITLHRMREWKIPMERFILPFEEPLATVNLTDAKHLSRIEALVRKHQTKLVVIDSLRGGHDGDENSSRVGRVLQELAAIAERTKAAVVVVHHTRKLAGEEGITANSSRGSNAIQAMMRSQIGIDRPDPNSKCCCVQVLKENLGLAPKPVGFQVTGTGLKFGPAPEKPRKGTMKNEAEQFLRDTMKPGEWHDAAKLIKDAEQQGISQDALLRARMGLGIVKPNHLKKEKEGWRWMLPKPQ
jgi:hypothetical protein